MKCIVYPEGDDQILAMTLAKDVLLGDCVSANKDLGDQFDFEISIH